MMSRLSHISRRPLTAIVLGVIAAAGATAFTLADASTGSTSPRASAQPTIQQVPPQIDAAFPVLRKVLDPSEAQQLPAVAHVMSVLVGQDEPGGTGEANSALARRIFQEGADAEYLVPGNKVLCMVSITDGNATGGGCAPAASVEASGTTSLTVVPGGYQVGGLLPTGTSNVRITDVTGETTTVAANPQGAFRFFSATPLTQLVYDLPGGGQHVGSLALPPPPTGPPPVG